MTTNLNRLHGQPGGDAHASELQVACLLCCPALYVDEFSTTEGAADFLRDRGLDVTPPAAGQPALVVAIEPMAGIEAPLFILDNSGAAVTLWLGIGELLSDTEGEALDKLRTRFRGVLPYGIFGVLARNGRTLQ